MDKMIPLLKKGDKITLVSPAKAIAKDLVLNAKTFWENKGFVVELGENCMNSDNYFAGTIQERLADFQKALDDDEIKAIICNRGGYGCVQLLDRINWSGFLRNPKWIVGFSDVTVFHQHLQKFEFDSIHATMPLNYAENSAEALETLFSCLSNSPSSYHLPFEINNQLGSGEGKLIGGNLSILYSLIGTDSQADYTNCILFIEDLSEQLYHIDRMFYALEKAGILRKIKGLIVGGMTDLKDTEIPFGKNYQQLILDHFLYRKIPIAFNFPAGHINDNRALILGKNVRLEVTDAFTELIYC